MLAPPLQPYESMSLLTLPADNGYWSVGITAGAKDPVRRQARHADVWDASSAVIRWRRTGSTPRRSPASTSWPRSRTAPALRSGHRTDGLVAVGDSAACTNPSIGRGATLAFMHAVCLRDVIRDGGTGAAIELARRWRQATLGVSSRSSPTR